MALTRDDFAAAFHALSTKARSPREVRAAFREQMEQRDPRSRKGIAHLLRLPARVSVDLRSDPQALDALGEMLIEIDLASEAELEKLVDTVR